MQQLIIDKPYRFIPSKNSRFWGTLINWWLPGRKRPEHESATEQNLDLKRLP